MFKYSCKFSNQFSFKLFLDRLFLFVCLNWHLILTVQLFVFWLLMPELVFADGVDSGMVDNGLDFEYLKFKLDLANALGVDPDSPIFNQVFEDYWKKHVFYMKYYELPRVYNDMTSSGPMMDSVKELLSLPEEELERRLMEAAESNLQASRDLLNYGNLVRQLPGYFYKSQEFLPPTCDFDSFLHGDRWATGFDPCN